VGNNWITTELPEVIFEDTSVGRLKKQLWDASEEEIDEILKAYEIGESSELGKAGCYIQNTARAHQIE
jgi:creatinine amidohydrolase